MIRPLILLAALAGCGPQNITGQTFGPLMPACVISCRSGIEATNGQRDSIINTSPRPVPAPTTR